MKIFGIAKMRLCAALLSLSACGTIAPPPAVDLCQYNGTPRAFFCENTETKAREKIEVGDLRMKAAQCLKADDYKLMSDYIDYLINEAEKRCR